MKNSGFTFRKRLSSFKYAFQGLKRLFTHEANIWIHTLAAICVVLAGFYFSLSPSEWLIVILVIGFVFSAEAFNSAIESLSDVVSPEYNEYIKHTKDLAAGAVLLAAITAAIIGILIFAPKIIIFFA
ncbi:diacylglycerol kinase family protein [Parabacteroides sp. 52]|uniref:diacylglycerol kinase family protein n=1 Tax=unclassified Parabacteroides TaxID=2649774 RepID=UPI0013D0099F|nr:MULTISPECIES: diacylglycerol kinase family protein [unclassified Parabacteroides]MDH6534608.1 diacylglycerol kinase (ATP) [Parabacteroides sp. PM5-20]NDV55159.1 diacylglycerol kinase family protein [Parabacteroides sp. 52]